MPATQIEYYSTAWFLSKPEADMARVFVGEWSFLVQYVLYFITKIKQNYRVGDPSYFEHSSMGLLPYLFLTFYWSTPSGVQVHF